MPMDMTPEAVEICLGEIAARCGFPRAFLDASHAAPETIARRWLALQPAMDAGHLDEDEAWAMLSPEDGGAWAVALHRAEVIDAVEKEWVGKVLAVVAPIVRDYARKPAALDAAFKKLPRGPKP